MPHRQDESAHLLLIEAERLSHLKRQMPLVLLANVLVAPFVALALGETLGSGGMWLWAGGLIGLSILRWLWVRAQRPPQDWTAQRLQTAGYIIGSGLSGLLWGLLGMLAILCDKGLEPIYALLFLCGMVAGGIGSLSTVPPVYFAFAIPAISPVIILYGLMPETARNIYAFAAVVFLSVNLGYAVNLGRTIRRTIELRFENEDLIGRLEAARSRAERESELKSRFLQSASHDLRQPLHAVTLLLSDISEQVPEKGSTKIEQAQSSVLSLSNLLDRLLEASRAGAGDMKPQLQPLPLCGLLRNLSFEYEHEARQAGMKLTIVETSRAVLSDELMLTQILRNYLSNALRHARAHVVLGARRRGNRIRLEVWDDGPGIPESQHKAIFDAFYQIGNPERDPRRGHGLGLAIVSSMARLLSAEHGLCSTPGRGSVFYVEMPLSRIATAIEAGPQPRQRREVVEREADIMIIEDNDTLRDITADMVRRWGYRVEAMANGDAALLAVEAGSRPHMLITDLMLPGSRDGVETARALSRVLGPQLPVAIVTGNAGALDNARQTASGLARLSVLKKPLLPGRLKAWIEAELSHVGEIRPVAEQRENAGG